MPVQISRHAWVMCPCKLDPSYRDDTAQAGLSIVSEIARTFVRVFLGHKPRLGMLLSVQLMRADQTYAPPIFPRVLAVRQQAEGQWIAHCPFDERLTEEELQALLAAADG
jgi:hypothetical protein